MKTTRSEGARLLALTGKTSEEIGARLHVSRSLVSHWLSGARRPTKENATKLKKQFRIALGTWAVEALEPVAPDDPELPPDVENPTTLSAALTLRRSVLRDLQLVNDPKLPAIERQRIAKHAAATLATIGKITGETLTISEAKILRSPAWQRIEATIVRILEREPERMREIGEALALLGRES